MKLLVNVSVPAIIKQFDMLIPDFLDIRDVVTLVVNAVKEKTNYEYGTSGEEILCYQEKNIVLSSGENLRKYSVQNGDTLILI